MGKVFNQTHKAYKNFELKADSSYYSYQLEDKAMQWSLKSRPFSSLHSSENASVILIVKTNFEEITVLFKGIAVEGNKYKILVPQLKVLKLLPRYGKKMEFFNYKDFTWMHVNEIRDTFNAGDKIMLVIKGKKKAIRKHNSSRFHKLSK